MKQLLKFLYLGLFLFSSNMAFAVNSAETKQEMATTLGIDLFEDLNISSVNDFLALTPKAIKEATGKRLPLKQVVGLKIAQKKIKKKMKKDPAFAATMADGSKSQLTALLLCIFVGALGIHRFYLGYTTIGIVQLLTLGACGIWSLIDLIMIITGDLQPADGSSYDPEL